MPDATSLSAGFMVVHGNRLDELRSLVVSWMRRYPLAPLENEIALVQSNGIAQWLKLALAEDPAEDDMGAAASLLPSTCNFPAVSCGSSIAWCWDAMKSRPNPCWIKPR